MKERNRFYRELKKIEYIRVIPSQANFFLCEIVDFFTSNKLSQLLLDDFNILIKDCAQKMAFDGRSYVRIAIRKKKDNDQLIKALQCISYKVCPKT